MTPSPECEMETDCQCGTVFWHFQTSICLPGFWEASVPLTPKGASSLSCLPAKLLTTCLKPMNHPALTGGSSDNPRPQQGHPDAVCLNLTGPAQAQPALPFPRLLVTLADIPVPRTPCFSPVSIPSHLA